MYRIWIIARLFPITVSLLFFSCAYFNTFYNAEKYFKEANKMRLEKSGQSIPLRAIDNYGKTIIDNMLNILGLRSTLPREL